MFVKTASNVFWCPTGRRCQGTSQCPFLLT